MDQNLHLKDIHLPEAVGWWPPAMGWWLLLILIPLFAVSVWWLYKKLTQQTVLKSARKLLEEIKESSEPDMKRLQALSAWLRRVSMTVSGRDKVAGLTGEAWLEALDSSVEGSPFSEGVGRCLADAQYRKALPEGVSISALIELCESWLKGQKG